MKMVIKVTVATNMWYVRMYVGLDFGSLHMAYVPLKTGWYFRKLIDSIVLFRK